MLVAGGALTALLFAAQDPASLVGLERLYFTPTTDLGEGAFHAEEVRRLLPGKLPRPPRPPASGEPDVWVSDFVLPVGGAREVVLRDVHDTSHRLTAQWWCLYDDGKREACWFFAPAPVHTEGKLLADYRVDGVSASAPDRLVIRTTGALFRPQGAFWLQGRDLVFTVSRRQLRLDHVVARYLFTRGYAVGGNEGPLAVSTESSPDGRRLVTRLVDGVPTEAALRCGFRELESEERPMTSAELERAALCITGSAQATVSERLRTEPSFVERGGSATSTAAATPPPSPVRVLGRQGRCAEAAAAGRAAVAKAEARQPAEPLAVAALLDDLMEMERLCLTPERRPEVRAWGERAVALREQALADQAALGESLLRLARFHLRGGEDGPAGRPLLERALEILTRAYGPDDPRLVNLLPWMQAGLDLTGAVPSETYRALRARESSLAERLRVHEDERLARALSRVDRIEVSRLEAKLAEKPGPGFPIHPYSRFARILQTKEVDEGARAGFVAAFQELLRNPGESARCHHPAYGVRFHRGSELVLETSLCFECHNLSLPFGSEHAWHPMSADRSAIDDMQARLEAVFARP
jgi:hypothetical protein